jgi:hypothetical protein
MPRLAFGQPPGSSREGFRRAWASAHAAVAIQTAENAESAEQLILCVLRVLRGSYRASSPAITVRLKPDTTGDHGPAEAGLQADRWKSG